MNIRTSFYACVVALLAISSYAAELADPLAGKPPFRRLFLDSMVVEESYGLSREFHAAQKHDLNPVIRKDRAWEGWGPYVYGTVMWDSGKLKMWYQGIGKNCGDVSYAESGDGIRWTKPELGIIEHDGSKNNNIVAPHGACHIPGVIRIPNPTSPDKRWAMYGFGYDLTDDKLGRGGPCVAYSPDGLNWNWQRAEEQYQLFSSSDVTNVFFDPYTNRFTATYKTSNRRHRAVGIALSEDGIKWSKPIEAAVFGADDFDPDATQIYGMPVFPYQGIYIGLPWMYHARWIKYGKYSAPEVMYEAQEGSPRTVDVQIAWSHDLISWNRTAKREPFISLGDSDSWDSMQIYTARAPVIVGDKLYFYYGGFDKAHDDGSADGAIGLATLRMDGFCSMCAGPKEGWLISRREVFNTPQITINARCRPWGYVAAEIVDRNNNPIPGFTRSDCIAFTGDSVRATLKWKTKAFAGQLIDKDKKIKFYIKNAELYSYLPADINAGIDDGNPDH